MRALIVAIALAGSLAACADQRQEMANYAASQGNQNVQLTGWEYCDNGTGQGFVATRGGTKVAGTVCQVTGASPHMYIDDRG